LGAVVGEHQGLHHFYSPWLTAAADTATALPSGVRVHFLNQLIMILSLELQQFYRHAANLAPRSLGSSQNGFWKKL